MRIQWFPGHMAKTRRLIKASAVLVDLVVELLDARTPRSSQNPELGGLIGRKPRIILLNKCDQADPEVTARWIAYYREKGIPALATDCRSGRGLGAFMPLVREMLAEEISRWEAKGMTGRPVRMMIVGIPNVGKSSLINRLAASKRAKVEDRPGVTRGKQWVKLQNGDELLDMPGVLWPKFEDKAVGERLAMTGAVKDAVVDIEELAMRLAAKLYDSYPALFCERYGIASEEADSLDPYDLLCLVGRKRGMLMAGGAVNTERAAIMLLDEFRGGKIGRISLEKPKTK